ncbi:MAG: hypothetical protein HY273_13760 [Gammaproteobacteria bacterium]|nr:hypothetical protein [Gammaproteobacteria bacterium]
MRTAHQTYAALLSDALLRQHSALKKSTDAKYRIIAQKKPGEAASLDITPFVATPKPAAAAAFFSGVRSVADLIAAYHRARESKPFENDLATIRGQVHDYARAFMSQLLAQAEKTFSTEQARLIAAWVCNLDIYVAVKAVESLLNSKADMALLEIAADYKWTVHFDHLAIRCGHAGRRDAERVVEMLRQHHDYVPTQVAGEDFYQFSDGWNAYPLYKILDNGQVLRLFIDQSDAQHSTQIIRHWNRVYGFTAHHMGLRATLLENGVRRAVTLLELTAALAQRQIAALTPTGDYTQGLLLQVFTKPERNADIPDDLKLELRLIDPELERAVQNAKLLELVSREEAPATLAPHYFALYGLNYDAANPLHSVPAYQYFLPAQAAHVINTSVQTS